MQNLYRTAAGMWKGSGEQSMHSIERGRRPPVGDLEIRLQHDHFQGKRMHYFRAVSVMDEPGP
jgi:hypothetical protein